ncbi:hypothetical protein [Streptomyces sp. R35]|uniref:Uncharacterized protein n=1 Tax=Streptomyces sp. R35 TaxID=3238630 RepID=A0AB39S4H7_9ACTN
MYRVGDVPRCTWWPYSARDGAVHDAVDGLWLPASQEDGKRLLEEIVNEWSSWTWLLMGTWYRKRGETDPSRFEARYPGLAREVVGRIQAESPRGLVSDTEWCVADPHSDRLFDFLETLRRSRGKGGCAVLAESADSLRSWYALSGGMFWRASLALELEGMRGSEVTHDSVIGLHLQNMSERGYVSLIPLDLHPEAGFAAFTHPLKMERFAADTLKALSGFPLLDTRDIFARGGGLAV